ncbi:MAG TPA: hypothetical protein VMB24_04755 [Dehalococcoidales bacterium]|nr:hypothetical protein [Dehalococcoidales bacterium]
MMYPIVGFVSLLIIACVLWSRYVRKLTDWFSKHIRSGRRISSLIDSPNGSLLVFRLRFAGVLSIAVGVFGSAALFHPRVLIFDPGWSFFILVGFPVLITIFAVRIALSLRVKKQPSL